MVNFRKSAFVFALLMLVATSAFAQFAPLPPLDAQQVACVGFQNSVDVRAEGSAEQLGDINYQCTVSLANQNVVNPANIRNWVDTTIRVTLNSVPIASRLIGTAAPDGFVDTVDAIAEFNSNRAYDPRGISDFVDRFDVDPRFPLPQYGRKSDDFSVIFVQMAFPMPGSPNPTIPGLPRVTPEGTISPFDSGPGDNCLNGAGQNEYCFPFVTQFRITNLRGNVARLGGPGVAQFPATQVLAFVSTEGPTNVVLSTIQFVIGAPRQGLFVTTADPIVGLQCNHTHLINYVKLTEGFPTAFRTIGIPTFQPGQTQWEAGYPSFAAGKTAPDLFNIDGSFAASMAISGINGGGASQGTRFRLSFFNVPEGVEIRVPYRVSYSDVIGNQNAWASGCLDGESPGTSPSLQLRLVPSADANGAGGGMTSADADCGGGADEGVLLNVSGGFAAAVYEVYDNDPFAVEMAFIPISFSWWPDTANDLPEVRSMQFSATFAPVSTLQMSDPAGPIPRFVEFEEPETILDIQRCLTVLLFPWVTNRSGFDTGFAVANTSEDWLGTDPQTGRCTLHFHGETVGGGIVDDQTSIPIPAGDVLLFTLSGGNLDYGLEGAPEFAGYIIVVCEFQFAHGFAFITDGFGGIPTLAQGYLALVVTSFRGLGIGRVAGGLSGMESLSH